MGASVGLEIKPNYTQRPDVVQNSYPAEAGEVGLIDLRYPRGKSRRYGVPTDGLANARAALLNAQASSDAIELSRGTYLIGADTTITAALEIPNGAQLKPAAGVTLTLRGPLLAGTHRIFDMSAGGAVSIEGEVPAVRPEWFGARADGKVIADAAMAIGSPVLTSATASFSAADVGKPIHVHGAGGAGVALCTTIQAFTNATTVTLAANAVAAVAGAVAVYGTDCTAAIQAAHNAAPANGTVECSSAFGFYWLPGVAPSNGLVSITKNLTFRAPNRRVTIKHGPEQPVAGGIVAFRLALGVDVTFDTITIEGPEKNNNQLHRSFGWAGVDASGTLTLRRVNARKAAEVVKLERSASLDSTGVILEDCDISNANDGATAYVAIQVGTIGLVYGGYIRASRTKFRAGGNSYCIYRAWQTSLALDDCDFGPGDARGTSPWLLYAEGGAATAPTFDEIVNCRFDGSTVTETAVLTNKYAKEQISNCTFKGRALQFRGDVLATNCTFTGGFVGYRNDMKAGCLVQFSHCTFEDCQLATGVYAAAFTVETKHCTFVAGAGAAADRVQFNSAGLSFYSEGCTYRGGPSSAVRFDAAARVRSRGDKFFNAGNTTAAMQIFQSANVVDIRVDDAWFEDPTIAYAFGAGGFVYRELGIRQGMKTGTIASADTITLDWNFSVFRITGVTTINKICMQGVAYTSHPNVDVSGEIVLLVEGAFALGAGGNILADGAARVVDRAVRLRYNQDRSKWVEVL